MTHQEARLKYPRGFCEIKINHIKENLKSTFSILEEGTGIIAVLKSNAYGHGATSIVQELEDLDFLWGYAVATLEEGIQLRQQIKSQKPILILSPIYPEWVREICLYQLTPSVFTYEIAEALNKEAAWWQSKVFVHIPVETGMGRIGISPDKKGIELVKRILELPNLRVQGIFSHFATSDEVDKDFAIQQLSIFHQFNEDLKAEGIDIPIKHLSNSAAALDIKEAHLNLVRVGIVMYGVYPSLEIANKIKLKPALSWYSSVAYIKEVEAGTTISYGRTYKSEKKEIIATIPIGYGDGFPRALSNQGYVLIKGQKAPIVGRICMDQFMVNITGLHNIHIGDEVVLLGKSGELEITLEEIDSLTQRFPYEFLCNITERIPRIYTF